VITTGTSVISVQRVWNLQADINCGTHEIDSDTLKYDFDMHECNFDTHECDFDMKSVILTNMDECDINTHKCDKNTHECHLYTQSMISSRILILTRPTLIQYAQLCYFNTLRVTLKQTNQNVHQITKQI
jgi:hypothetical protein